MLTSPAASLPHATPPASASRASRRTLKAAAVFWFIIVALGQLFFAIAIFLTYGAPSFRGDFSRLNRGTPHAYVPGEPFANAIIAAHIIAACFIVLSGTLQLIPAIQRRAPRLHRWNGRLYILAAFSLALGGVGAMVGRGTVGTPAQHIAQYLNAALIMAFAVMAWRTAVARDFSSHRRWALRLYLTVGSALFLRAATFLMLLIPGGPYGIDVATFTGPFVNFISYGQYLIPLAVLELYLRAQHGTTTLRFATASLLFVLAAGLGAGTAATAAAVWAPRVRAALDPRISIADTLAATIASSGTDVALQQYRTLKATAAQTYNFDEPELNTLGYQLLNKHRFAEAIRVLQLNTEVFPNSANVYDSLGEAYADAGDKPDAIAFYRKSLTLNPKNLGAIKMLQTLNPR